MRFRDFGEDNQAHLTRGPVSVLTASIHDSDDIRDLRNKNKEFLHPWSAVKSSNNTYTKVFNVKYEDEFVGQVILFEFNNNKTESFISYWISEHRNNLGICTTSLELITEHCFTELGMTTIEAAIQPHNFPSIRVAQKVGFVKTKTVPNLWHVSGKAAHHDIFTLRPESAL